MFDQGETFGGYVQTGNEQDFIDIANAVYKPINKVVVDQMLENTPGRTEKGDQDYMTEVNSNGSVNGGNFLFNYVGRTDENKANFYDTRTTTVSFTDDASQFLLELLQSGGSTGQQQGGFDAVNVTKGDIVIRSSLNYQQALQFENMGMGSSLFYQDMGQPAPGTDAAIFKDTGVNPDPSKYIAVDIYSRDGKKLPNKTLVDLNHYQNMGFAHNEQSFPGKHVFQTRQFVQANPTTKHDVGGVINPTMFEKPENYINDFGSRYTPFDEVQTLVYNTFYPNQSDALNAALKRPDNFVHPYTKAISDIVLDTRFQDEIKSLEDSVKTAEAEILKLQGDLDDADSALARAQNDLDTANKALNKAANDLANVPPDQTDALNAAKAARTKAEQDLEQANIFLDAERDLNTMM